MLYALLSPNGNCDIYVYLQQGRFALERYVPRYTVSVVKLSTSISPKVLACTGSGRIRWTDFVVYNKPMWDSFGRASEPLFMLLPHTFTDEFKALNLKGAKSQMAVRKQKAAYTEYTPRTKQMPVDQDWGNVWPGPKSFHPATVPLPIRQGYSEKGVPPGKYANAELMKIPNFLHLTPPVIKRQCEALKKFCTPWPTVLNTDEKCEKHFPIQVTTSNYCHSSPSIRNPLARIVTVKFKLSALKLDQHAKDKFLRLVGDRYNEETDEVAIVTDRCPLRKQNYEYAMYLITALYHESQKVEAWENLKSEADMEFYDWNTSTSKKSVEKLFGKETKDIPEVDGYSEAISNLLNEGESEYLYMKYGESVRRLLKLPTSIS